MATTVAVAIVAHNSADDLRECLVAVAGLLYRPLEVVIVDCASHDASAEIGARWAPREIPSKVLRLEENLGFAGGLNRAIATTGASLVLSLNPDTCPSPDAVDILVNRISQPAELKIGAVTGRLLRFPEENGVRRLDACGMRLTPTWRHLDRGSGEEDAGQLMAPERVFGATGAATLFSREALEDAAVDGEIFLSEFHSFREDAELCFRLRERGWEVIYEPRARILHRRFNVPSRRRSMPAAVNYHSLKNRYLLRAYHQTASNFLLTLAPACWRDLAALGYVLIRERTSLPAYSWLWKHRRHIASRRRLIQGRRTARAIDINRWFYREALPLRETPQQESS